MRLLVVEDDPAIRDFLTRSLGEAGYVVDATCTAEAARTAVAQQHYAALIVDLGLPDQDGFELITQLRKQGLTSPVLILSARRSVDDRVRGLEEGGDDYMTKPFAVAELTARIRNLVRRVGGPHVATRLHALDLELDLLGREARRGERLLHLTAQEFSLLEFLCRNADRVVTRSMILEQVWKVRAIPDTNVVDVHIYRLRSKVDQAGERSLIRTLRGVGYVLRGH